MEVAVGVAGDGLVGKRHRCFRGGLQGEGEAPEVVGVAGFVAARGNADAAAGGGDFFGFAEVVAEAGVGGVLDAAVFVGLQQLDGEGFGDADGFAFAAFEGDDLGGGDGGGEVDAVDFGGAKLFLGILKQAEAEAGHVDGGAAEAGEAADFGEAELLVGEAEVAHAEDGADVEEAVEVFEDGEDGEVDFAADVEAGDEGAVEGAQEIKWELSHRLHR